jgi:uncharacterized protein (DUF58 family)
MESRSTTPSGEARPIRRSRLAPWLHRAYFHGAGVQYFIERRLRPAGIALLLVFVLGAFLAVGNQKAPVFQLFSLSLGMIVIGILWAMTRRANVTARRDLPRFGTAGQPLRYTVRVRNTGHRKLIRAWITDTPPDPRPDRETFTVLREPGEEERNPFDRFFSYYRWKWLMLTRRLFTGGSAVEDLVLNPGEEARVTVEMTPLRRGVIRFDDLRLLLPDPFGLFQRCRHIAAPDATLLVLPRRFPLPPVELPGGAAFKISGEANTNVIGNSGEFVGLRDYRPGDPLRQIHWKSWARTGRPIVKELEDTHYPRFGLIVDTLSSDRDDTHFEEVISVAASFAAALDTGDSLLDLMFIKNEAHRVTAGRGVERAEKLLEVLAGVTPQRSEDFSALSRLVLRHRDDLTSCLIILNGWDDGRAGFLKTLSRGGVTCVPLVVGSGPAPVSIPGPWLESGNIAADLQRLPTRMSPLT